MNGKVNPDATQGKDGDKYVNTETGDVFVKNNGNWEKEGNIKGPKGDKGAQGLKVNVVKTEPKVYQAAMDVMEQQVVTDEMAATEKMS